MIDSYRPIGCCDSDCAGVNHCRIGGYQCVGCGRWFCSGELDEDGYCDKCQEQMHDDEGFDDEEEED